ncbi:MAG: hypothetical protein ACRDHB_05120 [Actinomycetota bacterium]
MPASPEERRFQRLADRFLGQRGVSEGTGFGTNPGLRVGGKVFAMLIQGDLVLKLPRERVNGLIESGVAERFDPGHGRPMKEWVAISAGQSRRWPKLADEAFEFVRSASKKRRG